jgi:hypothetical protein
MKIIFTSIFSLFTLLSFAQVPTQDLIFAHDFNGIFSAAIPENLAPYYNDATLGQDNQMTEQRALSLEAGQNMRFYNDFLQAGATNGQLTVSLKFSADYESVLNMPSGTYANLYNSGDCFIRILKTSVYFLQIGLNNGNNSGTSFGYITIALPIDIGFINNWNSISMVYFGTAAAQNLELHYNGEPVAINTENFECEQGGNVIYLNYDMVIGDINNQPFTGSIDELFIHNRALSPSEIWNIHNSSSFVGVNEADQQTSFNVYPNPTNDVLFVESLSNDLIEIRDIQGALITQQKMQIGINQINTSELAPGIYLVKSNNTTKKFIKA